MRLCPSTRNVLYSTTVLVDTVAFLLLFLSFLTRVVLEMRQTFLGDNLTSIVSLLLDAVIVIVALKEFLFREGRNQHFLLLFLLGFLC